MMAIDESTRKKTSKLKEAEEREKFEARELYLRGRLHSCPSISAVGKECTLLIRKLRGWALQPAAQASNAIKE
jgi:hypothetical protein